jgi:putative addiction module component (TIGR02574 family)
VLYCSVITLSLMFAESHVPRGDFGVKTLSVLEIAEMPILQRIQLVEDIWDSIAEAPEAVQIPEWHKQELEKRLEAYHANPDEGSPWHEVKKRIMG